jgi:hypothetical protein
MEQLIGNDSRLEVGGQLFETIKGSIRVIKAEQDITITGARTVQVLSDDHLDVAGSSHTQVEGGLVFDAGQTVHITGDDVVIDGGLSLTVSINGQQIVLNPAGIFVSSQVPPDERPTPAPLHHDALFSD